MTANQANPIKCKYSAPIPMSGFSKVPGLKESARDWNLAVSQIYFSYASTLASAWIVPVAQWNLGGVGGDTSP